MWNTHSLAVSPCGKLMCINISYFAENKLHHIQMICHAFLNIWNFSKITFLKCDENSLVKNLTRILVKHSFAFSCGCFFTEKHEDGGSP